MAKKRRCVDCVNHRGWATPDGVSEQNYEYAKQCLVVMKRSMTCLEKNLVRKIDHELYCPKFCSKDEYGYTGEWYERDRQQSIETLKKQVEEYEREHNIKPVNVHFV